MPDTRRQEKMFPQVDDWMLTTKYPVHELLFLEEHLGETPGVALPDGVPEGFVKARVEGFLTRVADLSTLGDREDSRYFQPVALFAAIRQAITGYVGYCAERESEKQRTGMSVPHDSMYAFDDMNRLIGYQGPGSDAGRVRVFDVPLVPQADRQFRRLSQMWLEKARQGADTTEITAEEAEAPALTTEQLRSEVEKEESAFDVSAEHSLIPSAFIQHKKGFKCPVGDCQQFEGFKVSEDGTPHISSRRAAERRMIKHCKTATEYSEIHSQVARIVERGPVPA